jgi:hypothetical protein
MELEKKSMAKFRPLDRKEKVYQIYVYRSPAMNSDEVIA